MNLKILLIITSFFNYENVIQVALEKAGATVKTYDERSIKQAWEKALLKVNTHFFTRSMRLYYQNIIRELEHETFDYVLIAGATMVDSQIIKMLKEGIQSKTFYLYLMDSQLGNQRIEHIFPYFDKILTYDRRDWEHYRKSYPQMRFLPLFYSNEYRTAVRDGSVEFKYDLGFVGTIHSDRQNFLNKLESEAQRLGLSTHFYRYLPAKFMYLYYFVTNSAFRHAFPNSFKYEMMPTERTREFLSQVRCVVDAQHEKNTGLTMRTLECLGMRKKLITANQDIVNYDFYDPQNILVVDRETPVLTREFLNTEYRDPPPEIYDAYSIDRWVRKIFEL